MDIRTTYYSQETSTGGYVCPCGEWVSYGSYHVCYQKTSPDTVRAIFIYQDERIITLLERIANALEKLTKEK